MAPIQNILNGAVVFMAAGLLTLDTSQAQTWQNETDNALEADYANLQFPASALIAAGGTTAAIYGRIYEAGVTEAFGPAGVIAAQLGYGPAGSDPRTNPNWSWLGATYNVQVGNDDEYQGTLTVNTPGSYSYTYRFTLDGGSSYTLGDLDGAGSNAGLTYSTTQMGSLEVVGVPEPNAATLGLIGLVAAMLAGRKRRDLYP